MSGNGSSSDGEIERWLQLSKVPDPRAASDYAQRAVELQPDDPRVIETVQHNVLQKLNRDSFVAFLAETDKTYIVTLRNARPIAIPKAREQPEIFPSPERTDGERAVGMVWWMVLGLIPSGIGALILSPFVMRRGLRILNRKSDPREERLAWLSVMLAAGFGLVGAFFALLLGIHLAG